MDAGKYLSILRRGWLVLIIACTIGLAVGAGYSLTQPKQYRSTATVYLSLNEANTTGELNQGLNYLTSAVQSYSRIATMPVVLDQVARRLRIDTNNTRLSQKISTQTILDTQLITISAVDSDPEQARLLAQTVAEQLQTAVSSISPKNEERQDSVKVVIVAPAATPRAPFAPQTTMNTAAAGAAALFLGVVFLIIRDALDNRVRDEETLAAALELPILASVPHDPATSDQALITNLPHSGRSESFRQLRTNLQYIDYTGGLRSVVITSPNSSDGKTTTAINLAEATTALGVSVLLVDADLRRPKIHDKLGLEGSVGLSTVLAGLADARDVVQQFGEKNLYVLPAGHIPPNPSELLGSQSMAHLLNELCELFDLVILDAAPTLPVTDPTVLGMLTDGAVLVVNAKNTTIDDLEKTADTLMSAGVRVLGSVLNQAPPKKSAYYEVKETTSERGSPRPMKRGRPGSGGRKQQSSKSRQGGGSGRPGGPGQSGSSGRPAGSGQAGSAGARRVSRPSQPQQAPAEHPQSGVSNSLPPTPRSTRIVPSSEKKFPSA